MDLAGRLRGLGVRSGDRSGADQPRRRPSVALRKAAILLPGEDGLFFVPLLLVGINPLSAVVAAAAFGAMHYPEFPSRLCVAKACLIYLIALLILPHGLGTVVVGHFVIDALAYVVWRWTPAPVRSLESEGK